MAGKSTSLLLLLGRLGNQYVGLHFLAAAALANPAHRRRVQIIAADGQPAIGAHGGPLVGDIDALPADLRSQPDVHPGVAGGFAAVADVAGVEIAADVASRYAHRSRGGDVHVRVILANAFAALERDRGAVLNVAGAGLVAHRVEDRFGQRLGARYRILGSIHDLQGE